MFLDVDEAAVLEWGDNLAVEPSVVAPVGVLHVARVVPGDKGEFFALPVRDEILLRHRVGFGDVLEDGDVLWLGRFNVVLWECLGGFHPGRDRFLVTACVVLGADVVGNRAGRHARDHAADGGHLRPGGEVHVDVVGSILVRELGYRPE